jgi:hypothetical protein
MDLIFGAKPYYTPWLLPTGALALFSFDVRPVFFFLLWFILLLQFTCPILDLFLQIAVYMN